MVSKIDQDRNYPREGLVDVIKLCVTTFVSPVGYYRAVGKTLSQKDSLLWRAYILSCTAALDIAKYTIVGERIINYFSN